MRLISRKKQVKEKLAVKIKPSKLTLIITNNTAKKTITWRCSEFLLAQAKNSLISRQASGDYAITSFSDLVRSSLIAYQQGMPLTNQRPREGNKKEISLRLDANLREFYQTLPKGSRAALLERILASFLVK